MRRTIILSLCLIGLLFFLPWLWGGPGEALARAPEPPENPKEDAPSPPAETPPAPQEPEEPEGADGGVQLTVLVGGKLCAMDMGTYLQGVLRAEMPASFEEEALKAQAVAARTYTIYKIEHGGSENHPQADACDDITCCKAYESKEEAAAGWGGQAAFYEEKMKRAVADTDGECVLYEGKPILAVFHSSSAGATSDAASVWSESLPYLKSVASPEGEDTVPGYKSTAVFTAEELYTLLREALPEAELEGAPSNWFTNIRQMPTGTVTRLSVGGVEVGGNQLRTILGLRSACFTLGFEGDTVTFSVTGYGHGVGMSQYGANVLAQGGMGYKEILAWYYTGAETAPYAFTR